jgi:hypothetical protein
MEVECCTHQATENRAAEIWCRLLLRLHFYVQRIPDIQSVSLLPHFTTATKKGWCLLETLAAQNIYQDLNRENIAVEKLRSYYSEREHMSGFVVHWTKPLRAWAFVLSDYTKSLGNRTGPLNVIVRFRKNKKPNIYCETQGETFSTWIWESPITYLPNPYVYVPSRYELVRIDDETVRNALGIAKNDQIPFLAISLSHIWMSGLSPFEQGRIVRVHSCQPISYEFKRLVLDPPQDAVLSEQ